MSKFSEQEFEQRLFKLKDSHDSIASLSNWCLANVEHNAKIVAIWLGALKKVKTDHRVLLFYLANDIIQYSKKKVLAYVGTFAPALQKATTMVRDPSIRNKILRIFKIWDERNIYDETFLVDLSSLLTRGHKSANRIDLDDFQPNLLYSRLKSCQTLEEDTDSKMKLLVENPMPLTDTDRLRTTLKNRKASEDVILEIDEGIKKISAFIHALEAEIKERTGLIDLLDISEQYYEKEFGEAKIVSNAYKCFTNRVKSVKKKLDDKIETLPSPVPTPSPTAPSPEPDPLDSSDDRNAFEFAPGPGGTSFMDGSLFSNQSIAADFGNYYGNALGESQMTQDADVAYSPESIYNGNEPYNQKEHQEIVEGSSSTSNLTSTKNFQQVTSQSQIPPVNVPPVFNYFRPITQSPPPLPPVPEAIPGLDQSSSSHYNATLHDTTATSDCSSEGLKIEVITSPAKDQTSLSTLLESIVAETSTSLPPPPAPPTMDFAAWGGNNEYWESPESPPLFEKEGIPGTLAGVGIVRGSDVDMRTKDVDHRNLISLTGGVEQDWDFPPSSVGAEENEDMEMSDEDVGKIEDVNDALINKSETDYTLPAFPILPLRQSVDPKGNVSAIERDTSPSPKSLPDFGTTTEASLKIINSEVLPKHIVDKTQSTGQVPSYLPPPPPPPLPSAVSGEDSSLWANCLPPPPAPPFDTQLSHTHHYDNTIRQHSSPFHSNNTSGTSQQHCFNHPLPPRGFEPPPPPPPFPPLQAGGNFTPFSASQVTSFQHKEPISISPMGFDQSCNSNAVVGHPIPSFDTSQSIVSHFDRQIRPPFFGGFRPRFNHRNFFRGGNAPNRLDGQFRSHRQRFQSQRF